jgi:hypothetical protein
VLGRVHDTPAGTAFGAIYDGNHAACVETTRFAVRVLAAT